MYYGQSTCTLCCRICDLLKVKALYLQPFGGLKHLFFAARENSATRSQQLNLPSIEINGQAIDTKPCKVADQAAGQVVLPSLEQKI